jgi:hypothetical protein
MTVLCCHDKDCDDREGFHRIQYCVRVSRPLFDKFFNSRYGYRAEYFKSPEQGLQANRRLLDCLLPSLIHADASRECPDRAFVRHSLSATSAKAWLAEPSSICLQCAGEWKHPPDDPVEISNRRWELASDPYARWGRTAPAGEKIKVFGAFLNDVGEEYVAQRKERRALDIHEWGWS